MPLRPSRWLLAILLTAAVIPWVAAETPVSRQQAEAFAKKVALIVQNGAASETDVRALRTPVTEVEVNSWFAFRGQRVLPEGVSQPVMSLIGNGRLSGGATLDLAALAKRRGSGGMLDLLSYIGGRVPVTVTGVLHTEDGRGRFEVQEVSASGVPLPKAIVQELVSAYTSTPEDPRGLRLDGDFELPVNIRRIEMGQGEAVVVQ